MTLKRALIQIQQGQFDFYCLNCHYPGHVSDIIRCCIRPIPLRIGGDEHYYPECPNCREGAITTSSPSQDETGAFNRIIKHTEDIYLKTFNHRLN